MSTSNFTTTITVDQSPREVFDAVNNVRGWWSEETEGSTDTLNAVFHYHYEDVHRATMKITELIPEQKVVWQVQENYFKFTEDKSEWIGNTIIFDIKKIGNKTELIFTQIGLVPEYECYDICEKAWTQYIQQSLYNLITTGKGQPNGKGKPSTDHEKKLAEKQS